MTFGIDNPASVQSSRRELAEMTAAQRGTVDALALYVALAARGPVDVAVTASPFERGAVLVLVTPDAGGAPDPITAVYAPNGERRGIRGETDYLDYLAAVALIGGASAPRAIRREGTAVYVVRPGGSYVTEAEAGRL